MTVPKRAIRRSNRTSRLAVTAAIVVMGSAVALAQLSFMRNMYTSSVVLPQVAPRVPVEDAIAVDGPQILDRLSSRELPNPVPNTPETLAEGEWLYGVYCAVCHGTTGLGDGQIAEHYPRMPNLSAPNVQNYTDGWIYSIIREGGRNMPKFAASMSVDERWALVHFLRTFETR
jgi:mono/diheme cytochrome c family protein